MSAREAQKKRKHQRLPRNSRVVHEPVEFPAKPGSSSSGRLRDLSPSGLCFESDREYETGTILKLALELPGWEKEILEFYKSDPAEALKPLVALAEVRWVKKSGRGFEVGVLFVNVDEWHGKALTAFLEKKGWKRGDLEFERKPE